MKEDIMGLVREKKLLLEKQLFEILDKFDDKELAKNFLDGLEKASGQKIITLSNLNKNVSYVKKVMDGLDGDTKAVVEKLFVKLGMTFEITREYIPEKKEKKEGLDYKIFYADNGKGKKIEVRDFVGHFRARYQTIQRILMHRPEMQNLTSIGKLGSSRESVSIIGIVSAKQVTKNKNLMITFEDLTGSIKALVKFGSDCFDKANELQLDDVVAVKGAGNKEIIFAYDIIYPDCYLPDKVRFDEDICVAFVSDVHAGSGKHLGKEFQKFVDWINKGGDLASKIKYIFFVGDNIDGVGVFPGQERVLNLKSSVEQYKLLASYLKQIPENITMFMCPGQHDAVRVPEPQPIISKDYGYPLYDIPNLVLVSNPAIIKLIEGEKEFKVLMYHGASIHSLINEIEELRLMKAHKCPAKAVKHMLKRRHLAPTHSSVVYVPNGEFDPLVIDEAPDVLCTGEVHRLDIETYNGTLIITGSCWQSQTEFEEKVGNVPDPCKVPILSLKTRELKILDFSEDNEK